MRVVFIFIYFHTFYFVTFFLMFPNFVLDTRNLEFLWPNLKNLSGGLNLSRGLNMVGST